MKARNALIFFIFSMIATPLFSQEHENPISPIQVTDQIIVQYHPQPTHANALGYIKQGTTYGGFGVAAGKQNDILNMGARVDIEDAVILANDLESDPQVAFAEPDYIMQTMQIPNDSRFNEQWHFFERTAGINLPAAWDITTGSKNVIVGVIDTGITPHKDIENNLVTGFDFISNPWIARDGDGRDSDPTDIGDSLDVVGICGSSDGQPYPQQLKHSSWHGTHVSGTIAAETNNNYGVSGVTWNSKIMPLRVLGRCGGYTSDITAAIRWAAGLAVYKLKSNPTPVKVINMSLGANNDECPLSYQKAINEVVKTGVTIVAAAGNGNANARGTTPANCDNVITVGAVNRAGDRSFYSNFGRHVDIAAPGGEMRYYANGILSTSNSGETFSLHENYDYYQGTSMAAPHVAGVVALIYAVSPNISPARVEEIIKTNARPFTFGGCNNFICGAGIIDAAASVLDASDEHY